jgi:hypothetical protein
MICTYMQLRGRKDRCSEVAPETHIKGIDRPFGGRVESILIRSVLVNWRLSYFFYFILKGLHHKINKKPSDAA